MLPNILMGHSPMLGLRSANADRTKLKILKFFGEERSRLPVTRVRINPTLGGPARAQMRVLFLRGPVSSQRKPHSACVDVLFANRDTLRVGALTSRIPTRDLKASIGLPCSPRSATEVSESSFLVLSPDL